MAYLRRRVGDILVCGEKIKLPSGRLMLQICADRERYSFHILADDGQYLLGTGRTQLMSTEAMQYQNFTGAFFGIFAEGPVGCGKALFSDFCCLSE